VPVSVRKLQVPGCAYKNQELQAMSTNTVLQIQSHEPNSGLRG
jgi:hypothetical protein